MTKFLDFNLYDNTKLHISSPYFKKLHLEMRAEKLHLVISQDDYHEYFIISTADVKTRMKKANEIMDYITEKTGLHTTCQIISIE